ncbi:hypothetical protein BGZ94_008172 [Podila epigama]|nr:hypothetical protein BGZ94_008172 [Podila epigama]
MVMNNGAPQHKGSIGHGVGQAQQQQTPLSDFLTIDQQQEQWIKARQVHRQQLLTEHFGFSPLSFVDDVINAVNNMIYQASMALQEFIELQLQDITQNDPSHHIDIKQESEKGMHKFETLLEASVDKNFDRFELYALKNIFGVPEDVDVVLPHYEALDFDLAQEREDELDEDLAILRRQVIATKALNFKLRKELELEEKRRRQLLQCRDQIQFLRDAMNEYSDVAPVPQTLIFVRDNIETLHRRFQALHNKLEEHTKARTNNHSTTQEANAATNSGGGGSGSGVKEKASSSSSLADITPPESIPQSLRETLINLEPDQRAMYIRTVVRRQIEEHLEAAAT